MEKRKFDLCAEVLRRFEEAGILGDLVLVGSWCVAAYRGHFGEEALLPPIRTRDVDLLAPASGGFAVEADVEELLDDLGFVIDFRSGEGWTVFNHPELIVEFLAPARGRDSEGVRKIKELGVNAVTLRFMDMLRDNPIEVDFRGVAVKVPRPAAFAAHKLLVAGRRRVKDKGEKDRNQALAVLEVLKNRGELGEVEETLDQIPKKWRRTVLNELADADFEGLAV